MPVEPHEDTIRPVMDSVQPFVSKGDFASACGLVSKAIAESLNAGRSEDAATLSSILASFLSISGANESALEAFERAEIAKIDAKNETGRSYAQNLLDRARAHSHAITEKRARTLLSCFASI